MSKYELSIIIPAYNMGLCLYDCLANILKKEIKKMEVIVVDDGSTDDTTSILSQFKNHPNFRYVTTCNRGVSAARNEGLSMAEGEYLWFVDADDEVDSDFIEPVIRLLENGCQDHVPWDLVLFGSVNVTASGKKTVHSFSEDLAIDNIDVFRRRFESIFTTLPYNVPWNKIFRYKYIKEHGLQFPAMTTGEDAAFMTSYLPYVNNCFISSKTPYKYMLESTSSNRSTRRALKEYESNRKRIIDQGMVFSRLQLEAHVVQTESIVRLVYGTYKLVYHDVRRENQGLRYFLKQVRRLPDRDVFLSQTKGRPLPFKVFIIRLFSMHPALFYVINRCRDL